MNYDLLENCCEILDSKRVPITAADRKAGPYPYYGANGIQDYVAEWIFDDELVLLAEDGGNFGSKDKPIAYRVSGKCWVNNHAHVLKPRVGIDVDYLCYSLMFYNTDGLVNGATRQKLTQADMRKMRIPVRDFVEQHHIVGTLGSVSLLIEKRKRQLAKLDELVKSRFIELFGDPETNPNKWPISRLSEFCDLQNGYAFKSGDYLESSAVLNCRMSNIRPDGGFDAEYHPKYLPDMFWEKYRDYRLKDGDVIIAMTDMASDPKILGVPTIVRTNGKKFLLNQRVGKLTFFDDTAINNVYLMFVLSQKHIRQQLVKSAGGSTQINVGKPAVLGVELFVPPMGLQEQFAVFVEQTDKSKLAVQQSLEKLETLKRSLMQQYFG